ncbi:hypothetical protein [Streptomyces sp. 769]|uniref:hypothetical protein n=1 Tax=Streptomyces sp. 769 TaxID=1262452 RepID=UPI000581C7A3|nr:hypothetical protein [Streptomyces sp. 769]AJC53984.1 hypothetical protein GZL_01384 [Streptomyces sp. 769]
MAIKKTIPAAPVAKGKKPTAKPGSAKKTVPPMKPAKKAATKPLPPKGKKR